MYARVRRCAMAFALAAIGSGASALGERDLHYPPRTILILVASWCAPCRAEMTRLDAIEAAAGGRAVRIVAIDDSVATQRMLRLVDPARLWRPDAQRLARVRAALVARTAGLPYSVATDAKGAICAEENGGLDAVRTNALVHRCEHP